MVLILLEALLALLLLVLIVWWTMFSGRRAGELPGSDVHDATGQPGLPPPRESRDNTCNPPA
jgi:hypothetical protein